MSFNQNAHVTSDLLNSRKIRVIPHRRTTYFNKKVAQTLSKNDWYMTSLFPFSKIFFNKKPRHRHRGESICSLAISNRNFSKNLHNWITIPSFTIKINSLKKKEDNQSILSKFHYIEMRAERIPLFFSKCFSTIICKFNLLILHAKVFIYMSLLHKFLFIAWIVCLAQASAKPSLSW